MPSLPSAVVHLAAAMRTQISVKFLCLIFEQFVQSSPGYMSFNHTNNFNAFNNLISYILIKEYVPDLKNQDVIRFLIYLLTYFITP
jgi:ABC-type nitrate/sulfonate/bicarbonate transport system permease component